MLCVVYTHPRHEFHKDGQFFLHRITQAAVVLHDTLMTQVLQQLNLTLQCIHFLWSETEKIQNVSSVHKYGHHLRPLHTYLAGLLTLRVKGHLLGCQLTSRVNVVAEVDLAKSTPTEQFPLTPVYRSPWG